MVFPVIYLSVDTENVNYTGIMITVCDQITLQVTSKNALLERILNATEGRAAVDQDSLP